MTVFSHEFMIQFLELVVTLWHSPWLAWFQLVTIALFMTTNRQMANAHELRRHLQHIQMMGGAHSLMSDDPSPQGYPFLAAPWCFVWRFLYVFCMFLFFNWSLCSFWKNSTFTTCFYSTTNKDKIQSLQNPENQNNNLFRIHKVWVTLNNLFMSFSATITNKSQHCWPLNRPGVWWGHGSERAGKQRHVAAADPSGGDQWAGSQSFWCDVGILFSIFFRWWKMEVL